jgi:hypothetical protein
MSKRKRPTSSLSAKKRWCRRRRGAKSLDRRGSGSGRVAHALPEPLHSRLDDAIASLSYVVDLTCLSEWQGHFRGNWELRKILLEAITSYRRAAYRCHVFLEAGLLDVQGTSRVSWQLSKCRELLRTLDLPLLIIDGEDLNGWASYDPPRAMDPLIKGEIVWPNQCRNRRPYDDDL